MILIIRKLKIRTYPLKLYYLIYMLNNRYWKKSKLYKKISNIYYKQSKQKKKIPWRNDERPFFLNKSYSTLSNIFLKKFNLISYFSSSLNILEPIILKNNYYSFLNLDYNEILIGKIDKNKGRFKRLNNLNNIKKNYFYRIKKTLIKTSNQFTINLLNDYRVYWINFITINKKLKTLNKNRKLIKYCLKSLQYENNFLNKILEYKFNYKLHYNNNKKKKKKIIHVTSILNKNNLKKKIFIFKKKIQKKKIIIFLKKLKKRISYRLNKKLNKTISLIYFKNRFKRSENARRYVKLLVWKKRKEYNVRKLTNNIILKYTKKLYKNQIKNLIELFLNIY